MRLHEIEVDNEVFEYLKKKAEPFVDTPNSVLRRELPLNGRNTKTPVEPIPNHEHPSFSAGTPAALQQILEVVHSVLKRGLSRQEATKLVAKNRKVAPQTVLDKYCRQLDLTAYKLDRLLEQPGLTDLKVVLNRKFPNHRNLIDKYLDQ